MPDQTNIELYVRIGAFLGVFALMALYEILAPRRSLQTSKGRRWWANLGIVVVDSVLVRIVFPAAAVGTALYAQEHEWGLWHYWNAPYWVAFIASVIILDFVVYIQHVVFHAVPALWRLHMVHHADLDFDVTTGLRFHPIEIVLSMGLKIGVVAALGAPPWAVIVFEVLLNGTSMFNHSNVRMPAPLDRVLRLIVVTPDMHRVHHSVESEESNSNFGFNLPWWDRFFGTYKAQPDAGHDGMTIGLGQFRDPKQQGLLRLLWLPFVGKTGAYTINKRKFD